MEWLHLVVITLIYVHEPKTVTWAKECEIPDYAYSEKRRKNHYGDEFVCLGRDVERDQRNTLYDTKLLSINTRKKNEDDKPYTFFKENRDPRYIQNNHYILSVLQPPTSNSTFQMLLHRYQPYGYGPYTMITPKSIYNIYRTKSPNEDNKPRQLILPVAPPAIEDVTTNWGMEISTSQMEDVINQNHKSLDQNEEDFKISENQQPINQNTDNENHDKKNQEEDFKISKHQQPINQNPDNENHLKKNQEEDFKISKLQQPINQNTDNENHLKKNQEEDFKISKNQQPINRNTDNENHEKLLTRNKVDILEPLVSVPETRTLEVKIPMNKAQIQELINPPPNLKNSTKNTEHYENLNPVFENMVQQIISSPNADKTNAGQQRKVYKNNKSNKFSSQISNDGQWKQIASQQRIPLRHQKQKKGPLLRDNSNLASKARSFNPENEQIQEFLMPGNESAPGEYESEAQKVIDFVQPGNMNNKLGKENNQVGTIPSREKITSINPAEYNKNITSNVIKKNKNYQIISKAKNKNYQIISKAKNNKLAHSFFTNHMKGLSHGPIYVNKDSEEKNGVDVSLRDDGLQYLKNIGKQKLETEDSEFEIPVQSYLFDKRDKREEETTISVNSGETETDVEDNTDSSTLNESKEDYQSPTEEPQQEMKINSNETDTEVKDRTVDDEVKSNVNFDFNHEDNIKPISSLEKLYRKLNIFRSRDKGIKNRAGSNSTFVDNDVRDIRTVEKEKYKKEFDQDFMNKWMELQQAFMNHLEKQNMPVFPVMNAVEVNGTSPPQFPVEIKLKDNIDSGFPIKLKELEESKIDNEKNQRAYDITTIEPLKATAVKYETKKNQKRGIHCCFKLNDGQHCGEHDTDREQLKQIDLKIENKKRKGCPLKETCIEMILTKDKSKLTNNSTTGNVYNYEMPPFRIGVKNYTHSKSKVSKIQGIKDFNQLNSLAKVNKSQDKWEKQIQKLFEIINEEKKGEERNKTTYSSLHKTDKDLSKKQLESETQWNMSATSDPVRNLKEEIPKKLNKHVFLESKPGQNMSTEQIKKILKDKKSRKMLANQIISECHNTNSNKETVDPLPDDLKVRYNNFVNQFREDLMKIRDINHDNNSSYLQDKNIYTEGIKLNSPIVNISRGLESKAIKGNTFQNPEILLHKVYKSNSFIPNPEMKAKLLNKCENLKRNISQILILMSELQDERKSSLESMDSCPQYTGFNNLLNNLRKFNRHPSFSTKHTSGKNEGTLSKLRMGHLKDLDNKHEKDDGTNLKDIDVKQEKVDGINLRGAEEDRKSTTGLDSLNTNLTDTIDIRLIVPTIETNEEGKTSKGSDATATVLKGLDSPEGKLSPDILNTKVSEENQNNVVVTQNGEKCAGLRVTDPTDKTNSDPILEKETFDHINETDVEVPTERKYADEINENKNNLMNETSPESLNDKYLDSNVGEIITEVYPSSEMLNEKGSDILLDRGQHSSNESVLDSMNGKSILKVTQKDTSGIASSLDNKEDADNDKPSNENKPCLIKLASFPTNYDISNSENTNKKLEKAKYLNSSNSSGIFHMSKFTNIADQMQDIPHKLTMPIIMDILNSLMYEESSHMSENKEDLKEKRLKRDNFKSSVAKISPSSEDFEINMKVKKGKRKKNKKKKALMHKFTRSKIKPTTEEMSIKSAKRNKNLLIKQHKIKPIYMPNLRGHSDIHIAPPFLFGDNIITINVTPCDDYYKSKNNNRNQYNYNGRGNITIEEIKNNDTSKITEPKYFVMSNIKGEVTEKATTNQETQLRIPLKIFRNKEKITTIAITPESRTRKFTATFSPTPSNTNILQTELNSFKAKDFQQEKITTRMPILKLKNENQNFHRIFEKIQDLNDKKPINTSNERMFDLVKPMNFSYSTKRNFPTTTAYKSQTPEQMEFTFTITLKPPKAQNLKTPIENISDFVNTSYTSTRKSLLFKNEKLNQTYLDYDTDYQATENQIVTSNWMPEAEPAKNRIFDPRNQIPGTSMDRNQYLMFTSPPPAMRKQPWNKVYNFDDQLFKAPLPAIHTDISPFKYGYRTTQRSLQTLFPEEFKDTDYNIIYQDFKELNNGENLESLKANITKENFERERFEQTSEEPLTTESLEDYIFDIEEQTDESEVENDSEVIKEPEGNPYEITRNQEMQQSTELQTDIYDENVPNENSTEIQYDDELESVIETFGERPRLVSLFQPLATTEPITEAQSQNESEESYNNLVLDYGIPIIDSNQETTQNKDAMVLTEIIQVQPQTESPNQPPKERDGPEDSIMNSDWYKVYQKEIIPNYMLDEQSKVIATTYTAPTVQELEDEYKFEESSNEDEEEEDNDKDEKIEEEDTNTTTVKLAKFQSPPPTESPKESSEEEPEEVDEYDEEISTDFQELLFWQNITKQPRFELNQTPILPIETQPSKYDFNTITNTPFDTNTTTPEEENNVKAMKLELEQLRQLLNMSLLANKKDSFTVSTSTQTIDYFTQEVTTEKLIPYEESTINNESLEAVKYPDMEQMNLPSENNTASKENNDLSKTIEEKSDTMEILNLDNDEDNSKYRNSTDSDKIDESFLENSTKKVSSNPEDSENDTDNSPTEEAEEDVEISSEDSEVMQFDDLSETIDANNAMEIISMMDKNDTINIDPNIDQANSSKLNELKILDLENATKILETTNQVELPPTQEVNSSELHQPSLKDFNLGNDSVQIKSARRYKTYNWSAKKADNWSAKKADNWSAKKADNWSAKKAANWSAKKAANWSAKKAAKALRENHIETGSKKENISSNLENDENSEVILLDNISNDPADWVLHEEAMWNMDPWGSFKQQEKNKFNVSSKEAIQRDKILKNVIMSKIETDEPKFLRGKNGSTINLPNQNADDFGHHSNLFVKLNREPLQSKSRHLFDQISRKYIKAPHRNNKYNKNKWNDRTKVLFQPNLSTLKDKYSEENEKHLEMQPFYFGKKSLRLNGPKLNAKRIPEKANSYVKKGTLERQNNKISSSKRSKINNKSPKYRNPNSKKKLRVKQKVLSQNKAETFRNTSLGLAASNFTHGQNNSLINKTERSTVKTLSTLVAHPTQSIQIDKKVNQLQNPVIGFPNPGPNNNLKLNTNLPFKARINKNGNVQNLLWDRDDRWDRLDNNLNRVEKLYDRNIIKKINQNFKKNMYGFDTKIIDRGKNINSSSKSNLKNFNFYKQRLNRKMTLLKSLQNKNSDTKITPEEERKIKKILDGIISRYKGRTNDTADEDYVRLKTNKYNIATRRNATRIKNHKKFPKTSKVDRNKLKCRLKEKNVINNLTDTMPQHRFISARRNKKLPILPIYNRLAKQYRSVNDRSMGWHPMTKIRSNKNLFFRNSIPQSEKENYELLHRHKKNYVLGIPYIRTFPSNNSTGYVSIINTQLNKLPNCNETESFNWGINGITRPISGNSPDYSMCSQKKGKFANKMNDDGLSGAPIHGILSLVYPDDVVTNTSEPTKECNRDGKTDNPNGFRGAGYAGAGIPFNNYQLNSNQFDELLKTLENCNSNTTENSENKYKDLALLFKENPGRNKTRDNLNEVKAKLKMINWLLNFRTSQKINKIPQCKQTALQSTSCAKQDASFMESPIKDREDVENMKKIITKYKTLLKMFEEQYGKIDIKDAMNQKFMKNYREDVISKDGTTLVQRPVLMWKKLKGKDKTPSKSEDTNKNLLDSNNKKKSHKISFMYGQNKQRKDMDSSPDDLQDGEDPEVIKPLQDDDDDNLETCNDIVFESYDEHQLDKIKDKDLAINNMSQSQLNGTRDALVLQPMPGSLLGKYKNLETYNSYHNMQTPRLKSNRENEGNYKLNSTINKLYKSPLSCIGETNNEKFKGNWDNWTLDKPYPNAKPQLTTDEPQSNMTMEDKEVAANNILMLPIKFNTTDFVKLLNFKEENESDSVWQDEEMNHSNQRTKVMDLNNRNGYVFDVDRGGPNGIKNRYYITFDSLSPNTVKVKNISTIPMSNFSNFVSMTGPGLNVMSIHKFMSPWDKNMTQTYINNRNVKGILKPEIRSIEKVCLWLRKPLSYNLTHQVPKVAISLGEVWPPMSEGQGPRNMKHYLVQVDPLLTLSKFPNQHIDYPSQISKVVWKAILHGFKTPKKTWQLSNQLG